MEIETRKLLPAILVSSLGYFVDLYDLLLFSVVRTKSLVDLGVPESETAKIGLELLNWMLVSMFVGGIFWGILGDKKGRLWVLFGSIFVYSAATFLNAYVTTVEQYRLVRIFAGFGLAGELGAAITLVTEIMNPEKRGFGTMLIASVGMLGAGMAAIIGINFSWRFAFQLGGIMGFALLLFRFFLKETEFFKHVLEGHVSKGNIIHLIGNRKLLSKYLKSVLLGIPVYFVIAIMITLAPEFGRSFGMKVIPSAGLAVLIYFLSTSIGDILASSISQALKSRKKTILISLLSLLFAIIYFLYSKPASLQHFYINCAILGLSSGYWVVMITNIAEQFGTNYRSTVTTTAPNFLRSLLIPISSIFIFLMPSLGIITTAAIIGVTLVIIPLVLLYFVEERFGKPMDWMEN